MSDCAECGRPYDTDDEADACCAERDPRERGDDDGVEYADPRDYMDGLED